MTMSYPQTQPIHAFNIGRGLRSPSAFHKLQLYLFFKKKYTNFDLLCRLV